MIIVSKNESRNMQMVIIDGVTRHIPIDPDMPMRPKTKDGKGRGNQPIPKSKRRKEATE